MILAAFLAPGGSLQNVLKCIQFTKASGMKPSCSPEVKIRLFQWQEEKLKYAGEKIYHIIYTVQNIHHTPSCKRLLIEEKP